MGDDKNEMATVHSVRACGVITEVHCSYVADVLSCSVDSICNLHDNYLTLGYSDKGRARYAHMSYVSDDRLQ